MTITKLLQNHVPSSSSDGCDGSPRVHDLDGVAIADPYHFAGECAVGYTKEVKSSRKMARVDE